MFVYIHLCDFFLCLPQHVGLQAVADFLSLPLCWSRVASPHAVHIWYIWQGLTCDVGVHHRQPRASSTNACVRRGEAGDDEQGKGGRPTCRMRGHRSKHMTHNCLIVLREVLGRKSMHAPPTNCLHASITPTHATRLPISFSMRFLVAHIVTPSTMYPLFWWRGISPHDFSVQRLSGYSFY